MQAEREVTVSKACQEKWQNQDRKYENRLENACENRSDAKQGFQNGQFSAQFAKHSVFCTALGGNALPKMMVLQPIWVWKRPLAHDICKHRFSRMCFSPKAGNTFS